MTHVPTTLVLLDSTSDDGESALDLLTSSDDHVALVALIRGNMSSALREFAQAEDVDVQSAGWIYLDQVVERLGDSGRELQVILADGPNAAAELATIAAMMVVRRILLPSSLDRLDPTAQERLRSKVSAPITVAGHAPVASKVGILAL